MKNIAMKKAQILLPKLTVAPEKWACIACDQFTAEPDYWQKAENIVEEAPSTLRLTLPEIWLDDRDARTPTIWKTMETYLSNGILTQAVNGFVLTERETSEGLRTGLVVALDLEAYDFSKDSESLIRATEGTVASRVPPRAAIRRGAKVELPHVMVLIDDPMKSVIEPVAAKKENLRKLYDFDLMLGGGHLAGYAVEGEAADAVMAAMEALAERSDGLLYAMGDGNHSFAAAKQCWTEIRETLTEEERKTHPARYALAELVNLNCEALVFEPIHRVLFNADADVFAREYREALQAQGIAVKSGRDVVLVTESGETAFGFDDYPLPVLQSFIDAYLVRHPETTIDYIHGEAAVRKLAGGSNMGILLRAFDKSELFGAIRRYGALPRKTFSMGEATDKRYYMEARIIR